MLPDGTRIDFKHAPRKARPAPPGAGAPRPHRAPCSAVTAPAPPAQAFWGGGRKRIPKGFTASLRPEKQEEPMSQVLRHTSGQLAVRGRADICPAPPLPGACALLPAFSPCAAPCARWLARAKPGSDEGQGAHSTRSGVRSCASACTRCGPRPRRTGRGPRLRAAAATCCGGRQARG